MPLLNTEQMLKKARKQGYAVGAFNVFNLEMIQAIVTAAEETASPVIVQVSETAAKYAGFSNIYGMVNSVIKDRKVKVALHLDHGQSFESCKTAIDAGFTSVMIDLSTLPFEENIKGTKKVVDYAHARNVTVEGELGEIKGPEDDINSNESHLTNPIKAVEYIKRTGVDSLAVSIGTAHGVNKGIKTPQIHYEILNELDKYMPTFPFVCHGASSVNSALVKKINDNGGRLDKAVGIDEKDIAKMAASVISKINMDTDLRLSFTGTIREYLTNNPSEIDPKKYLKAARENVKDFVKYIICNILKSNGKL